MSKAARLVYLASGPIPAQSASSVHVVRMASALAEHTEQLTLLSKAGLSVPIESYYGATPVLDHKPVEFRSRLGLLSYLRTFNTLPVPDLAYGRYVYATLWAALRKIPTVYEVHAPAEGIKRAIEKTLFRLPHFKGLITITHALAQEYQRLYPHLANRIRVLPDAALDPGPACPPRANGRLRAAYAGSWFPGRGIELLVELARRRPEVQFSLAGGTREELAVRESPLPDNLDCVGYLAPAAVADFLRQADVLLAPYATTVRTGYGAALDTTRWCSPMKVFEYMAQGKAIICSDLPVLREVLRNQHNCLLVPPEQIEHWEAAVTRLDKDRRLAAKLGATARAQFLEKHRWDTRAEELLRTVAAWNRANHA